MSILSLRLMADVRRELRADHGFEVHFISPRGDSLERGRSDGLSPRLVERACYGLQESINNGAAHALTLGDGLDGWVLALVDGNVIHGGAFGGPYWTTAGHTPDRRAAVASEALDIDAASGRRMAKRLPTLTGTGDIDTMLAQVYTTFYAMSGWTPTLLEENRTSVMQQRQITQAIEEMRQKGQPGLLYAFEKERALLAHLRADNRTGARRILNEMLASIYLSSPKLVVLRARAIELMSCLTRAAIEDNPLLEPLIEQNHGWTEQLLHAQSFEELSGSLMAALDDFGEGIYLHGLNRSNTQVRRVLDFINTHHADPIRLKKVADHIGLSPSRTAHLVKAVTGRSVGQIVQETRIRHAQQLLTQTEKRCADIAYDVGFGDQSYFTKHFRKLTGTTPARYRRQHSH